MEICDKDCVAICDFCSYYKQDNKYNVEKGGICKARNIRTEATKGRDCEDFKCFNIKDKDNDKV
jgi:hypothetical protein